MGKWFLGGLGIGGGVDAALSGGFGLFVVGLLTITGLGSAIFFPIWGIIVETKIHRFWIAFPGFLIFYSILAAILAYSVVASKRENSGDRKAAAVLAIMILSVWLLALTVWDFNIDHDYNVNRNPYSAFQVWRNDLRGSFSMPDFPGFSLVFHQNRTITISNQEVKGASDGCMGSWYAVPGGGINIEMGGCSPPFDFSDLGAIPGISPIHHASDGHTSMLVRNN